MIVSIHAPPKGRDSNYVINDSQYWVSIHAPPKGRAQGNEAVSIHAPPKGRDMGKSLRQLTDVSIHAPPKGRGYMGGFNQRLAAVPNTAPVQKFQSTRPRRGATPENTESEDAGFQSTRPRRGSATQVRGQFR